MPLPALAAFGAFKLFLLMTGASATGTAVTASLVGYGVKKKIETLKNELFGGTAAP